MKRPVVMFTVALLLGCAKREPLPGDSVASDGAVSLSPPRLDSTTHEAPSPIEAALFSADFIMEHQAAVGITAPQRDALLKEIAKEQADRLPLQYSLDGEKEKLVKLLEADKIDEDKAQDAAARVMDFENRIKSAHLAMLIRLKNALTPEQQKQLRAARAHLSSSTH